MMVLEKPLRAFLLRQVAHTLSANWELARANWELRELAEDNARTEDELRLAQKLE